MCRAEATTTGRGFAAAPSHTFAQLAHAIDAAFARWDLAHMHMFTLADGTAVTALEQWDGDAPDGSLDSSATKLNRLAPGDQFAYVFDFGDDWAHLCTVDEQRSTRSTPSGSSPPCRPRTGAGATCPCPPAAMPLRPAGSSAGDCRR
ncbi:hypothetical protein GCM10028775_47770 [Catellatospora paridis]